MEKKKDDFLWWQKGVIYQIYPRSFKDSNNDGTGDLNGIREKLEYLKWLGINCVWISPFYPSPMDDFGYDISDYKAIHPIFGTMDDFHALVYEVHQKGMKIILDLVPNHTSYLHPWFQESKSSKENPKRDWYIWRDPAPDGGPPTNWMSVFGGSGWEYDENTRQYYYHAFLKEQPDLNWRNPLVKEEIFNVMKFWLEKGIDGFRVDVIWHMIKDEQFRDNPPNPNYKKGDPDYVKYHTAYSEDQPMVHEVIAEMRKLMDQYGEKLLIGEIYLPLDKLVTYYGKENAGVDLPFNFQLIKVKWDAESINALINDYEGSLPEGGWPNWVIGNHDKSRIVSRIGEKQSRIGAVLLLTLRGTPTIYYGDELGLADVDIPPDRIRDPKNKTMPGYTRDPERTPMQWDNSEHAGFSKIEPWLPISDDYEKRNVEEEKKNPESMLMLYKRLLDLRAISPALQVGDFKPIAIDKHLMVYQRQHEDDIYWIAVNFGKKEISYSPKEKMNGMIVLSTDIKYNGQKNQGSLKLAGEEAFVIRVNKPD